MKATGPRTPSKRRGLNELQPTYGSKQAHHCALGRSAETAFVTSSHYHCLCDRVRNHSHPDLDHSCAGCVFQHYVACKTGKTFAALFMAPGLLYDATACCNCLLPGWTHPCRIPRMYLDITAGAICQIVSLICTEMLASSRTQLSCIPRPKPPWLLTASYEGDEEEA